MIKIENVSTYGWDGAVRGMRNPMNSWDKSDSHYDLVFEPIESPNDYFYELGENDLSLMKSLAHAGSSHAKYRRMITVYMDITAPLYWWKEFDTYKVGTVANSCSTMHKIADKEFKLEDFSVEHLIFEADIDDKKYQDAEEQFGMDGWNKVNDQYCGLNDSDFCEFNQFPGEALKYTIAFLNRARSLYLETKDKRYWWQMIQLLPSSYNQKRTVMLNYEVLANIYHDRKNHKLDEWRDFCAIMKDLLPYSELFTYEEEEE